MRITKESQIIDKQQIIDGCNKLEAAFQDFTQCAKLVREAAVTCSPKALSVENSSMQPVIDELADTFFTYEGNIQKVTDAIKRAVEKQYNNEVAALQKYQAELKAEKERLEKQKQEAEAAANKSESNTTK